MGLVSVGNGHWLAPGPAAAVDSICSARHCTGCPVDHTPPLAR